MSLWLKQSTAVTVKFGPFVDDTDFKTAETALTISQADIRLSKNGGAFAQSNNAAGATHDANGVYGVPLDTTDTNTLGTLRVLVNETGALMVWQDCMVVPANVWDSLFGADRLQVHADEITAGLITAAAIAADAITDAKVAADVTIASVTGAVGSVTGNVGGNVAGSVGSVTGAVGSVAAGGITAASFAAGAIDASAIAANAIGASELAADAVTEIQAGLSTLDAAGVRAAVGLGAANLDTQLGAIDDFLDTEIADILTDTSTTLDDMVDDLEGRLTSALATVLQAHSLAIGRVVVGVGSTTTEVVLSTVNGAAASATNDFYNGRVLVFTSGALTLQAVEITDYVGATTTATVSAATSAPANAVTAVLV